MNQSAVTIDRAGRIVLPSEVRRRLNLQAGSRLLLAIVAERIELTPQSATDTALAMAPSRRSVLPATGRSFDAAAAVRDERAAQPRRARRR